jgi:aminopeptidase-like protein
MNSSILSGGKAMRFFRMFFVGCLMIVFVSMLMQAEEPLASQRLIRALTQEVSGEMAFNYTVQISHYDRIQACEGWHDAAVMIKKELERIGYTDVAIEGWPSNGSRYYYTYRTPIGWTAKKAELWMVSPEKARLCSYEEIPLTLAKHSNSADVEAELVDVGTGIGEESYAGKNVKGKIVLATAYTGSVMREAVLKRGALGVVHWLPPEFRPGYPNMIRYTAIWPTWEEKDKIGFGFNLSKMQGWNLKMALDEGKKVVLRAKVEAEYYDGPVEVLSAAFPGSVEPDKEVMIIGHLCHPTPSANDNASGSGGMLEMARALKKMVDTGQIEPPKRTIRFLWVPEFGGTYPYIKAHLERMRNTLSVINCDMIGEDFHLTGGIFNIICTPDSMPSYLNDVVVNFTKLAERSDLRSINGSNHPFAYRVLPFSGGSDHYVFNDGALKVPAVMFNRDDIFHHTSLDTPDKVDPTELRRVCFIALGASYYLASASDEEAKAMARLIARNGLSRLSEDYYDSLIALEEARVPEKIHDAYAQVMNVIQHSTQRELDSVLSALVFADMVAVKDEIRNSVGNIKNMSSSFQKDAQTRYRKVCNNTGTKTIEISLTEEEKKLARLIPIRNKDFVCPLNNDYVEAKLGEDAFEGIDLGRYGMYETLNFVDGKRSILDIAKAVSAEYGPVNPQAVLSFFEVLEKAQLLTFQ